MKVLLINGQNHKGSTYHIGRKRAGQREAGSRGKTDDEILEKLKWEAVGEVNRRSQQKTIRHFK